VKPLINKQTQTILPTHGHHSAYFLTRSVWIGKHMIQ